MAAVVSVGLTAPAAADRLEGLARVTDDGHLVIRSHEVALFGIDIPTFDRSCRRRLSPVRCGPRAVLVLDSLVRGFVHCDITSSWQAAVLLGRCTIAGRRMLDDRIDLAAELIRRGWAFAGDGAPPLYRSLERLARRRGAGMWTEGLFDLH